MGSILSDINTTIDNCDVQIIVKDMFDYCMKDSYNEVLNESGFGFITKNELNTKHYHLVKERLKCIRIYDLVDVFDLSRDDIMLLCKSNYVKEVTSMNWFIWKDDLPGYFQGTATFESAMTYLKTNQMRIEESVEGDDSQMITITVDNKNHNFRKNALCSQVILSNKFFDEFKEYFLERYKQ